MTSKAKPVCIGRSPTLAIPQFLYTENGESSVLGEFGAKILFACHRIYSFRKALHKRFRIPRDRHLLENCFKI